MFHVKHLIEFLPRGFTDGKMESIYCRKSDEMKIIMGMFVSEMK
jgi:hypothetical protein